jgi:penicillin-binding protein 1A
MGWNGRKREQGRREPRFDRSPDSGLDLRLSGEDRPARHPAWDQPGAGRRGFVRRLLRYIFLGSSRPGGKSHRLAKPTFNSPALDDDYDDHTYSAGDLPMSRRQIRGRSAPRGRAPTRRRRGIFRTLFRWSLTAGMAGCLAVGGVIAFEATKLPPIHDLKIPPRPPSIAIIGTTGTVLATRGEGGGRTINIRDLPPYLPQAFVAIEDRRFYTHYGFDPIGLARAMVTNIRAGGSVQGGSTLTQQLAKNLFLSPERSIERKIQELILSVWLETKFSKQDIMELYLNRVYFGSGAYGIEAAAQRYFNKPAAHVTLAEAAMLAGLVKAPSRLAPTRDRAAAEARAQLVLAAMADERFITQQDAARALTVSAAIAKPRPEGSAGYVADWVMDQLDGLVGAVEKDVQVDTSIDPVLQAEAEQALVNGLDQKGPGLGVDQGAIVVMDPQGGVKALVGGRSYAQSQFNRAVNARRQPGSTFKPIVYLTALERGMTPETIRDDAPVKLGNWSPENFDHKFRGPVTLTQALATSLNTVAVRLGTEVGPGNVAAMARRLGIQSPLEANASIALGTSAVSPLEMATAFTPFANGGYGIQAHVIRRIRGTDGSVLYERPTENAGQVIEPDIVGMMNMMMSETLRIGTARKAELAGWPAAGKTGTSQDFRDAWFVGYTAHLITTVWLGNDDNSPTKRASGSNLPVEIWSHFMTAAHQGIPIASLPGNYQPADQYDPYTANGGTGQTGSVPYDPAAGGRPPNNDDGQQRPPSGGSPFGFIKRLFGG